MFNLAIERVQEALKQAMAQISTVAVVGNTKMPGKSERSTGGNLQGKFRTVRRTPALMKHGALPLLPPCEVGRKNEAGGECVGVGGEGEKMKRGKGKRKAGWGQHGGETEKKAVLVTDTHTLRKQSLCKKPGSLWQYYPRLGLQGCRKSLSLSFKGILSMDFKGYSKMEF